MSTEGKAVLRMSRAIRGVLTANDATLHELPDIELEAYAVILSAFAGDLRSEQARRAAAADAREQSTTPAARSTTPPAPGDDA